MAFKKNGPGCCCGGGSCGTYNCTGGGGDFYFRITLSGTATDLGVNCPTVLTSGCTLPAPSYTPSYEFDCTETPSADVYFPLEQNTNCGTCSGGTFAVEIRQQILLRVGLAKHPVTLAAYDGVVAILTGSHQIINPSIPSNCSNSSLCEDATEIQYNFPFTYNSGESGFGGSPGNCPIGFGTAISATNQTATDNAVDVTGMSMSITYFSGLLP